MQSLKQSVKPKKCKGCGKGFLCKANEECKFWDTECYCEQCNPVNHHSLQCRNIPIIETFVLS
jgi:hypothetical protein